MGSYSFVPAAFLLPDEELTAARPAEADPPAVLSESFGTVGGEMAFGEYDGPELVLLVGPPAIGKTTYANNLETDGFEALVHTVLFFPVEMS